MSVASVERAITAPGIETRHRGVLHNRTLSLAVLQYVLELTAALTVLGLHALLKVDENLSAYPVLMALVAVAMWVLYQGNRVYQQPVDISEHLWRRLKGWLMLLGVILMLTFVTKTSAFISREVILTWSVLGFAAQLAVYFPFQHWFQNHYANRSAHIPTVIVGEGELGARLHQHIEADPYLEEKVLGFVAVGAREVDAVNDNEILGQISELATLVQERGIRRIYLALPLEETAWVKAVSRDLQSVNIDIIWAPDIFEMQILNHRIGAIGGIPLISLSETPLTGGAAIVKRLEDVLLSLLILMLVSPVMFAVALGVKLSSSGPVFYRQTRVSWNGEHFQMIKFRSMPVDTDKQGLKWGNAENKTNTWFGQFIRRTSLDELPQFFNVLRGEMSIVGPRPERDVFIEELSNQIPRYMQKHMVKAGITGWAQIHGWRGDTDLGKRIEFDLFYINNWSLGLDMQIIFKTIFRVFNDKSAR